MRRKAWFGFLALVLLVTLLPACGSVGQAAYPTKAITYVVTFDPGGQSDRRARQQQPELEKLLNVKVNIEYKVGGGGALGWSELMRNKADGYTVTGFNIPHVVLQPLQQDSGYQTEKIVPISIFERTPIGFAVLATSPYKTLKDVVDASKAKPKDISVGGSGTYTAHHMSTLRMNKMTGSQLTYVPFTGAAPQITEFLGGHVTSIFGNSDDLVKNKDKIRVLAMATDARYPAFPDVPTFKELGYDLTEATDRGVAVPPGTPDYIIAKLEKSFLEIAKRADVVAEMEKQGFVPIAMGAKESKAYLDKLIPIYKDVVATIK